MKEALVIIHGWSDNSRSFKRLGNALVEAGVAKQVAHVRLGDYISLDDDVTFDDLTYALQKAWEGQHLPTEARSVDVVIHSTGGLVIRHWMTTFFRPETNPIHHLLMLAPANFGSPLAHKGRSFVGRIVKGFKSDRLFQTGTHILKGLELASPFTWALADKDRFSSDVWYGPDRVLCTVLVGTSGYTGISAAANENGTDGTVRVSTANLDALKLTMNFSDDPLRPKLTVAEARGSTAFARLPKENHSTVTYKDGGPKDPATADLIRRAMQVTDAEFDAFRQELEQLNAAARDAGSGERFTHGFQNTVIRLSDNFQAWVDDYFFEVFCRKPGKDAVDDEMTRVVQEKVIEKVHAYDDNAAYRSLLFNTTELQKHIISVRRPLYFSVTASPEVKKTATVGYSTFGFESVGDIKVSAQQVQALFQPDRTVLIDLIIKREVRDSVFRLLPLPTE